MQFWFSQAPVYPQRVKDFMDLVSEGAGVAIATVVACLVLPIESRLLITFGTWFSLGLLVLLAGRSWARQCGLPFMPSREAKALNLAKEGTRPLPDILLWRLLPSGVLIGLMVAQMTSGHPFWRTDNLFWFTAAASAVGIVLGGVRRRARAAPRSRTQMGTLAQGASASAGSGRAGIDPTPGLR